MNDDDAHSAGRPGPPTPQAGPHRRGGQRPPCRLAQRAIKPEGFRSARAGTPRTGPPGHHLSLRRSQPCVPSRSFRVTLRPERPRAIRKHPNIASAFPQGRRVPLPLIEGGRIHVPARPGVALLGKARRSPETLAPCAGRLPHGGSAGERLDGPLHVLTLEDEDHLSLADEDVMALKADRRVEGRAFAHKGARPRRTPSLQRNDHRHGSQPCRLLRPELGEQGADLEDGAYPLHRCDVDRTAPRRVDHERAETVDPLVRSPTDVDPRELGVRNPHPAELAFWARAGEPKSLLVDVEPPLVERTARNAPDDCLTELAGGFPVSGRRVHFPNLPSGGRLSSIVSEERPSAIRGDAERLRGKVRTSAKQARVLLVHAGDAERTPAAGWRGTRGRQARPSRVYYTLHSERDGKVVGMLSVNASTGAVWNPW